MYYFTSDLHLGHHNIIRMKQRPFASLDEMNDTLIQNINDIVTPNDFLYILGDISFRLNVSETEDLIRKIHGRKVLIMGNHDKKTLDPSLFHHIASLEDLYVRHNGQKYHLVLCHYPIEHWNKQKNGSIHLHGHIHGDEAYNLKQLEEGRRRYDVGVDANDYRPVSLDDIIHFLKDCRGGYV